MPYHITFKYNIKKREGGEIVWKTYQKWYYFFSLHKIKNIVSDLHLGRSSLHAEINYIELTKKLIFKHDRALNYINSGTTERKMMVRTGLVSFLGENRKEKLVIFFVVIIFICANYQSCPFLLSCQICPFVISFYWYQMRTKSSFIAPH